MTRNAVRLVLLGLAMAGLLLLAFGPVLEADFVNYDDDIYVTDNLHVFTGLTAGNVRWAFGTFTAANWHPLTWLSHQADASMWGMNPAGHHASSLILFLLSALLLFRFLARTTGAVMLSLSATLLWALHPMRVESVAWVAERKDVLAGLALAAALLAYRRFLERRSHGRQAALISIFALGCMAKPSLVVFPALLLALDFWPFGRMSGRNPAGMRTLAGEKAPLLAVASLSAVVTLIAQGKGGAIGTLDVLPPWLRIANGAESLLAYLRMTILPRGLSVLYPHPMYDVSVAAAAAGALLAVGISAAAWRLRRGFPVLAFGWAWFLIALAPVLGIVQVGLQARADRYMLIPHIGLAVLVVWGAATLSERLLPSRRRRAALLLLVVVAASSLGVATRLQSAHWKDTFHLFRHAIDVDPENYLAHYNLGVALAKGNDFGQAERAYLDALRIVPDWELARYQLGLLYLDYGHAALAVKEYRALQSISPGHAERLARFLAAAGIRE
jgi:hypothetical protein